MADKINEKAVRKDMHWNPMGKTTYKFDKRNPGDKIWHVIEVMDDGDRVLGKMLVSFDKKKVYNLYSDYPDKMSKTEVAQLRKEYSDWTGFLDGKEEE